MSERIRPMSAEDVAAAVRAQPRIVAQGAGSKTALAPPDGYVVLDMTGLSGILEYEPAEYTFTAHAGTPLRDVAAALAEHGQFLPWDPPFVDRGATLGGTVAANLSGSGRYRYGGVRDFILGVHYVDGHGVLRRAGGKVVKNAAGFDLPKFFVGSLGRYGVLVTLSFKVFPAPRAYRTVRARFDDLTTALNAVDRLGRAAFELMALDLIPAPGDAWWVEARLGGPAAALDGRATALGAFLAGLDGAGPPATVGGTHDEALWAAQRSVSWAPDGMALVRVPAAPRQVPALESVLQAFPRRYTAGASSGWVAVPSADELDAPLRDVGVAGLPLLGPGPARILGRRTGGALAARVKQALDPAGKFPPDPVSEEP